MFVTRMNYSKILWISFVALMIYALSHLAAGCAQIGSATGGPRDSIPPVLINASPPNRSLHFNEKKIVLTFDEYIHVENVTENLIVSPTPTINPNVDYKLRTVTIKLRDSLEPNTTYRVELGNAIQDVNENNPVTGFSYVFSTGNFIDSLTLAGNVLLAETGKTDTTLLAELYNDFSDSAVIKKKPKYITKLDKEGKFIFRNLAPGTYHLFALKDESGTRKYTSPRQLFAFADSPVIVSTSGSPVDTIYAYTEEKEITKTTNAKANDKLLYNTNLTNGYQDLLSPLKFSFNNALLKSDTIAFTLTDTLFRSVPSANVTLDTTLKIVTISHEWKETEKYKLLINKELVKDTLGHLLLKNDTITITTKNERDYGSVKITFKNLDKFKNPVLQFVANNQIVAYFKLSSAVFEKKLFNPGEYELRILDDTNDNGLWDPGHYSPEKPQLQKQPEKVITLSQQLNIRANWANDRDITL